MRYRQNSWVLSSGLAYCKTGAKKNAQLFQHFDKNGYFTFHFFAKK